MSAKRGHSLVELHVRQTRQEGIRAQRGLSNEASGRLSCYEIALGVGGTPVFPLAWASDEATSFFVSPAEMRVALEAGGLSVIEQSDLTATRLGEARGSR